MEADYEEINTLVRKVKDVIKTVKPFRIYIKDFGHFMKTDSTFKRNYVLFLRVKKTRRLYNLWRIINENFRKYRVSFPVYVLHLTVTRRDLNKEKFYIALKEYRNFKFSGNFVVKEIMVSTRGRDIKKIIAHTVKLR